jgi:lipopolysaccharide/colanic/teichoic acid biosynthesis glycosyltransferase
MTTVPTHFGESGADMSILPEPTHDAATRLVLTDIGSAALVILLALSLHVTRSAILALTLVLLFGYWNGRYRQSYALAPRDELYATCAVVAQAALAVLIAAPLFQTSLVAALSSLVVWTAMAAIGAIQLTSRRRGPDADWSASCDRLDPRGRAHARNQVTRATISALDLAIALIAAIVLSPLFVLCAVAILFESGSPVLFRQRRSGLDGRDFVMYKFRTMRVNAGARWAVPGDERITRLGALLRRTSLDELPQLWNVLKGEMSLVGPRPEMSEYAGHFARSIPGYEDRHIVRPGITGWAQLHYERNLQPSEALQVVRYDLFYVRNYSVSLYMYCLIKTLFEVLGQRAV